jgi:hypothetical protein
MSVFRFLMFYELNVDNVINYLKNRDYLKLLMLV